jgi:hypothetical protein
MGKLPVIIFCFVAGIAPLGGEVAASDQRANIGSSESDDVIIAPNAVVMPLGKILLVRKDSKYCAIKFTKFWTGKTEEDLYASYEAYYQGDNTGDFSKRNVEFMNGDLSAPKPRGIGRLAFSFGKKEIKCGAITLQWDGKGSIYFYRFDQDEGDYGIQLAPTKWIDISQVNVSDSRLKWYRYDPKRTKMATPIDHLWEDK